MIKKLQYTEAKFEELQQKAKSYIIAEHFQLDHVNKCSSSLLVFLWGVLGTIIMEIFSEFNSSTVQF